MNILLEFNVHYSFQLQVDKHARVRYEDTKGKFAPQPPFLNLELFFLIHKSDLAKKDFSNIYASIESS